MQEFITLEDLFNEKEITEKDIAGYLRSKGEEVTASKVDMYMALYEGWKMGRFFVDGDYIGLRK